MKAILRLELFGDNAVKYNQGLKNMLNEISPGIDDKHGLGNVMLGGMCKPSSWVAEITGINPKHGLAREFLSAKRDYSSANSIGSRGIIAEYILTSGMIYEVKEQTSWSNTRRYFCTADQEGNIVELNGDEIKECLIKMGWE